MQDNAVHKNHDANLRPLEKLLQSINDLLHGSKTWSEEARKDSEAYEAFLPEENAKESEALASGRARKGHSIMPSEILRLSNHMLMTSVVEYYGSSFRSGSISDLFQYYKMPLKIYRNLCSVFKPLDSTSQMSLSNDMTQNHKQWIKFVLDGASDAITRHENLVKILEVGQHAVLPYSISKRIPYIYVVTQILIWYVNASVSNLCLV